MNRTFADGIEIEQMLTQSDLIVPLLCRLLHDFSLQACRSTQKQSKVLRAGLSANTLLVVSSEVEAESR